MTGMKNGVASGEMDTGNLIGSMQNMLATFQQSLQGSRSPPAIPPRHPPTEPRVEEIKPSATAPISSPSVEDMD